MRRTTQLGLAVAGATLVMLAGTQAYAQDVPPPPVDPPDAVQYETPAEARQRDVRLIAEKKGWGLAETANHLTTQDTFGALLVRVTAEHPESFAAGILADHPGGTSVIRFKGAVPAGVAPLVAAAGIPVNLVGGSKYSQVELRNRSLAVQKYLTAAGFSDVVTAVMAAGFVDVTIGGHAGPAPVLPPALRDDVRITGIAGVSGRDEHTRGGARTYDSVDGSWCTTGFTVEDAAGTTGVATAAHCTGLNTYDDPGAADYSMPFVAEHNGQFGDMEWHTSSHIEPNEFFATATTVRTVTSVEAATAIAVNNTYCVYGRGSNNRQCDSVYSTFISAGGASSLIAMDDDNTVGGDSGGGWSFGNEAAGIHKGDKWIWFQWRNIWSIADLLPVALGVTVLQ